MCVLLTEAAASMACCSSFIRSVMEVATSSSCWSLKSAVVLMEVSELFLLTTASRATSAVELADSRRLSAAV